MKEILIEFLFGTGEHQMGIAPLAIAAIGAAPGLIKAAGSLFGGGKRRRAERQAQEKAAQDEQNLRNFNFENQYANLENTAEDLTVNTQAANFQAQQTDAALAQGLDAIVQSGGGGGGAQAIADAALRSKQGISADIASQEAANQQARAQQAAQNQQLEAQGAAAVQQQQYGQLGDLASVSAGQLAAAQQARQQARADLAGGLAGGAAGAGSALAGSGALGGGQGEGFALGRAKGGESAFNRLHSIYAKSPLNQNGAPDPKITNRTTNVGQWEDLGDGRQRRITTTTGSGKSYAEAGVDPAAAQAYWDANPEEYAKYKAEQGQQVEYRDTAEERQPKSPPPGAPGGVGGPAEPAGPQAQFYAYRGTHEGVGRGQTRGQVQNRSQLRDLHDQYRSLDYDEVYDPRAYGEGRQANLTQDYFGEQRGQFDAQRKAVSDRLKAGELTNKEAIAEFNKVKQARGEYLRGESDVKRAGQEDIKAYEAARAAGEDYEFTTDFGKYYGDRTSKAFKTVSDSRSQSPGVSASKSTFADEKVRGYTDAPTNRMMSYSALKRMAKGMGYKLTKMK